MLYAFPSVHFCALFLRYIIFLIPHATATSSCLVLHFTSDLRGEVFLTREHLRHQPQTSCRAEAPGRELPPPPSSRWVVGSYSREVTFLRMTGTASSVVLALTIKQITISDGVRFREHLSEAEGNIYFM